MIYVFDMDNTLSYANERLYKHPLYLEKEYIKDKNISELWKEYYDGCSNDKPVDGVLKLLHTLQSLPDTKIIILTARDENARNETEIWLKKYNVNYSDIFMRQIGETIPASEVKKNCILKIQEQYGKVDLVFEDDIRNVKVFQDLNISVIKPDTLSLIR